MVTVANDRAEIMGDMPGPGGDGLSVRDLLATAGLAGSTVLAGRAGLDRIVRGVNVMEVPDILAWVKPDELLLTTAFPLTRSARAGTPPGPDPAALLELIRALDGKRLAALAIKLGRYLDEVPELVLAEADRLGFPVLRLPDGVAFDDVLPDLYGHLLTQQNQVLAQADALHRAISTIVLGGGGLVEIAGEVCRLLDCAVLITTPDGRVLADEGLPAHRAGLAATAMFDASGRCLVERLRPGVQPLAGSKQGTAAMTSIVAGDLDHGRILAYRLAAGLLPGTVQALERAAIVAALTITKELAVAAVEGKFRGDYLRDVLTGLITVDEQVVEHCRSLGWQIDRPMVVVVAELDPIEPAAAGRSTGRVGGQLPVPARAVHLGLAAGDARPGPGRAGGRLQPGGGGAGAGSRRRGSARPSRWSPRSWPRWPGTGAAAGNRSAPGCPGRWPGRPASPPATRRPASRSRWAGGCTATAASRTSTRSACTGCCRWCPIPAS